MLSKSHHALKLLYPSISLLVAASSPFPPDSNHECYFIDGSSDPTGGPYFGNVGASMCCYSGEDCHWGSGFCLASPNGSVGPYDNGSSIWRRSCTDLTWQDPACLAIAYELSFQSLQVTYCSDGSVCPRTEDDMNVTCCREHQGEIGLLGHARIPQSVVSSIRATETSTTSPVTRTNSSVSSIALATAPHTSISTSNSTPPSTSTSASTPISTSPSSTAEGLSQSARIGIGLGVSFGTLLIVLLSFIAFRLYRISQGNSPTLGSAEEAALERENSEQENATTGLQHRIELTGAEPPKEMYTLHNTHEVEAYSGASELGSSGLDG